MMHNALFAYGKGAVEVGDVNEVTRTKFHDESQKAILTIVMAISMPQLYLVTLCEKPKDAWATLKNHFEHETWAKKTVKQYFWKE